MMFFEEDASYRDGISQYNRTDGIFAVLMFFIVIALSGFAIFMVLAIGLHPVWIAGLMLPLPIIAVKLRKQKLSSIGISSHKWKQSCTAGLVISVIVLILRPQFTNASISDTFSLSFLYVLFYYFIVVSLSEELIFRGYIQTRIYVFIKSRAFAVFLGGILFMIMHLPGYFILLINASASILSLIIQLIIYHILLNFLYVKYNSVWGPAIVHGFVNFTFFV